MITDLPPRMLLGLDRLYNRPTSFRRGRGAFTRLMRWSIANLGFEPPLIHLESGEVFEYSPEIAFDVLPRDLVLKGVFEPRATAKIHELMRRDCVFVDVGANIGYFSILAAKWIGPGGSVIAFEPVDAIHRLLCKNISLNQIDNVTALKLACFSYTGQMAMTQTGDSAKSHLATKGEASTQTVSVTTLDDFFAQRRVNRIDCLKIDAEGSDFEVIKGARRIIEDFRPAILLETDHFGRFGSSKADVLKHFDSLDYSVTEMPGEHSLDWLCLPHR